MIDAGIPSWVSVKLTALSLLFTMSSLAPVSRAVKIAALNFRTGHLCGNPDAALSNVASIFSTSETVNEVELLSNRNR